MNEQPLNRKQLFLFSAISSYGAIFVSLVVGIISVPIGLSYFGPIRYGIWLLILSVLTYLRFGDIGIGYSTLTYLSQNYEASHQRIILRRSIVLLSVIAVVGIGVTIILAYYFPAWISILGKIPSGFLNETSSAFFIIVILTFLQSPMNIFLSAFSGLQQVHWNRIYRVFYSAASLAALLSTVFLNGNLAMLALLTGLGGLSVGIASGIHLFLSHPHVYPHIREMAKGAPPFRFLLTSGIRFFTLQISSLIILNTDNIIISHYQGPEMVTAYAITFQLFQMGLMIVTASIIALWPMYGREFSEGDWQWIQQTYNRSVFLQTIPGGLVWIGGIFFSRLIIDLWAGPEAYGGLLVAFSLGGYVFISSFGGVNHTLNNALKPTNILVVFGIIEAALNLVTSVALVNALGIGGVALGTLGASLAVNTWFPPLYIRYRTQRRVTLELRPVLAHGVAVIFSVGVSLVSVLFLPRGWYQFAIGVGVIAVYLALSWRVMPYSVQILIRRAFISLPLVRGFCLDREGS